MKITQVEKQKKNPQRLNIYIDGQFAFGADEDLIINYRLLPGKELSQDDLEKLLYEAEVGKLMERMYRLFNIRQRSEKEVRDYFKKLNFKRKIEGWDQVSDLVVDQVITRLKRKGMIDDKVFALSWVESRRRSKKKGPRVLKMELLQKGVARDIVDEVLSDGGDQEQLAREALEKKIRVWKDLPKLEFRKKAYDFLFRRGFDYQVIKKVID